MEIHINILNINIWKDGMKKRNKKLRNTKDRERSEQQLRGRKTGRECHMKNGQQTKEAVHRKTDSGS